MLSTAILLNQSLSFLRGVVWRGNQVSQKVCIWDDSEVIHVSILLRDEITSGVQRIHHFVVVLKLIELLYRGELARLHTLSPSSLTPVAFRLLLSRHFIISLLSLSLIIINLDDILSNALSKYFSLISRTPLLIGVLHLEQGSSAQISGILKPFANMSLIFVLNSSTRFISDFWHMIMTIVLVRSWNISLTPFVCFPLWFYCQIL